MKKMQIDFYGEKALFKNYRISIREVATDKIRKESIFGILGNICGIWRDFNNPEELENPKLKKWINDGQLNISDIKYEYSGILTETKHVFKNQQFEHGLGTKTYHKDPHLSFIIEGTEERIEEIKEHIKNPLAIPYFGQSDCIIGDKFFKEKEIE